MRINCTQWRRYASKYGEIAISKLHRGLAAFIPRHTPNVSVKISRADAASGLRIWRAKAL